MKTYKAFTERMKDDGCLKELQEFIVAKNAASREEEQLAIIEFAAGKGYEVTPEELSLEAVNSRELNDDEMENTAGGVWCWGEFSCIAAWYHYHCSEVMYSCKNASECSKVED